MANLLKIKRSTSTATPTSLAEGELAYSETSNNLFIGTAGGNLEKIGGNLDVTKLDGIESGATADQSASEIKSLYEGEADTNAYTDTEKTKLSGIASGAEVNVRADFDASSGDAQILNVPDPVITLAGDLSGSVTLTSLASGTLTATVVDDSHNHTISNVDGLQTALDGKESTHSHPYLSSTHDASAVTSAKISNWDAASAWYSTMTTTDGDSIINTVTEIVSAFENHAEGLNLITELDAKLTANSTIDGGTF